MIYLLDSAGQQIGPFENREEVERFVRMMALCGESWADNKIIEGGSNDSYAQNPAPATPCSTPGKSVYKLKLVGRRP
jgi:hypothetical protein